MAKETKYSIRDLKRDFPTDEACLALIFDTLHSRKCSCGGEYKQVKGRKQFYCSNCRYQIAPTANTIFNKSDTPLSLWFHAIFIFSNAKSGISAKEMERQLGVTYKCAWRILSMIRKSLKQDNTKLKGEVEIDTGFFGGKGYGGENNERLSHVMTKKSIVNVAVERGGKIKAEIIPVASAQIMESFIKRNIESKATKIFTDTSAVYVRSDIVYKRESVNHSKKEYVRGKAHVNTVETFFSHLKRSIKGTFKAISKQHLQSYLDAFVFHYNNRGNDNQRFGVLLNTLLRA
ncbi:MAG: IS1595 family transposase [Patescibacteria group bacterium]